MVPSPLDSFNYIRTRSQRIEGLPSPPLTPRHPPSHPSLNPLTPNHPNFHPLTPMLSPNPQPHPS